MQVTVLGAGSWGTTVASVIAPCHSTLLWARNAEVAAEVDGNHTNESYLPGFTLPELLMATDDLEKAMRHAELLIVGVPSTRFATLDAAKDWIHPWIPIVSLTKGLEEGTLLRMTQVIAAEVLPGHPVAALTGPNIAREIMDGNAAASVIATDDLNVATAIQSVLQRGLFRIYTNHDVIGCELGGVFKNVVAIACGIGQGLAVGDNTRAAVMTRGLAELTRLGVAMGGEPATFAGLAGMGDLVATCISPSVATVTSGEQLGSGVPLAEVLGGMNDGRRRSQDCGDRARAGDAHGVDMPVHEQIYKVVIGESDAAEAYRGLRKTAPGHEREPG